MAHPKHYRGHTRRRMKRGKGVPKNFRHIWGYRGVWSEKKIAPRKWKINFRASKGKKSNSLGNFKKGFKIHWKINADQYAVKTGKGTYQTNMIGTKTMIHSGYGKKFSKDHKKYKKNKMRRRKY